MHKRLPYFLHKRRATIFCLWREGLPRWQSGKEPACQLRRCRRRGFDPWVGKIPWRRKRQPVSVYLPGKFHGQRSLAGYRSPRVRHDRAIEYTRAHTWKENRGGARPRLVDPKDWGPQQSLCQRGRPLLTAGLSLPSSSLEPEAARWTCPLSLLVP